MPGWTSHSPPIHSSVNSCTLGLSHACKILCRNFPFCQPVKSLWTSWTENYFSNSCVVLDIGLCSLLKKPYLTPNHDTHHSNLVSFIHWKEDAVRCSDAIVRAVMTVIQLRFAEDIKILGGRTLKCPAQPLGNLSPFLMQRRSQTLQNCGNIMLRKARKVLFSPPGGTSTISWWI